MSTIDNNYLQGLGLNTDTTASASNNSLGQSDFLELLVAQLQNQDPMKPMENGEFLGQMAQFSTVSGIQDLQASFTQLASALSSNQALQASSLVGRTVLMQPPPNANGLTESVLGEGGVIGGAVDVPASSESLTIDIFDQNGQLVKRIRQDGGVEAGMAYFAWDGTTDSGEVAPPGRYQISASTSSGNSSVGANVLIADTVASVTMGGPGEGITLNLATMGDIELSDIKQIM